MADLSPSRLAESQARFAERLGVSRKTVTTWKIKGFIVVNESGQVDVEASLAQLRDRPATYRGGVTATAETVTGDAPSVTPSTDGAGPGNSPSVAPDPADFDLDDPNLPTAEAIRRKENFLGLLRRHEYLVAQGEYVLKTATIAHFGRAMVGVKRAFAMSPSRYASEMAGRLCIDAGALHRELVWMLSAVMTELSAPIELGSSAPEHGGKGKRDDRVEDYDEGTGVPPRVRDRPRRPRRPPAA